MKKDIHPKYYSEVKAECACGSSFIVGATKPEIKVEICSKCHPFYTGKKKIIDTAKRVKKFEERQQKKRKSQNAKRKTTI